MIEQFIVHFAEKNDVCFRFGGDLNARIGDWIASIPTENDFEGVEEECLKRKSEDGAVIGFGQMLIEFCTVFGLTL